jgi:DNA-binding winged helix-turn-helix (wHTH) protein/TolB-like protein
VLGKAGEAQGIDLSSEAAFRLGGTSIDPASHEATFGRSTERIQAQNLKVLIALAQRRGQLVTREELIRRCWDGRVIGDDVINRAISTLRQFAERAGGFEIETVPRAGYRLVETSGSRNRPLWILGGVLALIAVVAVAAFIARSDLRTGSPSPTIAILPFTTASSDPRERELATETRDALAQTLSRTEFQVALANAAPDHAKTAPDFIATADVGNSSGQIFVSVHVADTAHNIIVYSNRFQVPAARVSDLPEQVGAQVAGSLGWTASLLMLERSRPADPAVTASLFGDGRSYESSVNVAAKNPDSPIAQLGLAFDAVGALPFLPPEQRPDVAATGRRAAERARILAPQFGENEVLWCMYHGRGRMAECEDHLRAGIHYDPDSPWITNFLADRLKDVGRTGQALTLAASSWNRDPYHDSKIGLLLRMLEATGDTRNAQSIYQTGSRGWPNDHVIFWDRMYGILDRGDFDALAEFGKFAPPDVAADVEAAQPVFAALKARDLAKARAACPADQPGSFKRDLCMLALARLGDSRHAMDIAFGTYPDRIGRTPAEEERLWLDSPRFGDTDILVGPAAAPLRSDPRYLELARRLGLLAYWRSGRRPDFCQPPKPEPICSKLRSLRSR